ncbi:MAG: Crp/Fnr family transcriptional regulator [Chitinophagaceae bacterium]
MGTSKDKCDLERCYFCKLCLKEWLPAVSANRTNYRFKKGEIIFKEGEPVKGIYFVYEGKVKVHKKWNGDKELILRFANEGAILGHRGLGGDQFYPVSATALEPVVVCFIPLDFFKSSLKVNADLTLNLLDFFAEELRESEKRMRNMAHMSVKGRLAFAFLSLKNKFGVTQDGELNIAISRQDLASYVGATYETVFRTLVELSNENVISLSGKSIRLLNETTLVSLSTVTE